jgi:hypothetical protein
MYTAALAAIEKEYVEQEGSQALTVRDLDCIDHA